jgi:hypothetical protein
VGETWTDSGQGRFFDEIVLATKDRNIYLSKNWGKTWLQIAREARGLSN